MKISRKELYDLVWAEPMSSVCKRFGLSDNGLRKHCKSMNIPTPPNGYWSKLKYGIKAEIIPLPKESAGTKQSDYLHEIDPSEMKEINLLAPVNRNKARELEISSGDTSVFVVPEVLYAKDPFIIDTKERFRQKSDNTYLNKNPFKNKMGPTLDITVSEKSIERAISIFATIIKALGFRGHSIKFVGEKTCAIINGEEIQINLTERRKRELVSEDPYSRYDHIFCGELHFNVLYGYRDIDTIKDTAHTRIEDKIISVIANLEIRSEKIKEDRIEAERQRIKREKEELERKTLEERKKSERKEFKSLFTMAERLHKTNMLRQYISTYEEFVNKGGEMDDEIAAKIEWAKAKADWLDPFISKKDPYMDFYDKDEIIQPECPKKNSWEYQSYSSPSRDTFWSNPYRKWS
jgi:hypothetical protein